MRVKLKIEQAVIIIVLIYTWPCWAMKCADGNSVAASDVNLIDATLNKLNQKVSELQSYQSRIEYLFRQPLLDSQTLRKGILYYQKAKDSGKSALRIDFQTLKQDDGQEQKHAEQYIFDGVWLTHIDYQIKSVKRRQLTDVNEPADAFELASRNFPIIGFTKTEDLRKQFEIRLIEQQGGKPSDTIGLRLKVKTDSAYKNDYTDIEFWIDKKLYLPAKIVATSTENDIYLIKFIAPKFNEAIDKIFFDVKIPEGFGEPEVIPLKKIKP
jgi:outer membrane lipoprotein-sorting protein